MTYMDSMNALITRVEEASIRTASLSQTINAILRGSADKKWIIVPWIHDVPTNVTLQGTGDIRIVGGVESIEATAIVATGIVRTVIPHSFFNGRMISPDLLASSITGSLPNGRETWTSTGQLAEDVIAGRVLSKNSGALAAAFNPFAIFVDQIAEEITVCSAPDPSAGFSLTGQLTTLVDMDLVRSTSPDWFE